MSTTIFMIHGTFAPNAPWTQPGSLLRTSIELATLPSSVRFEQFCWSGSNFHSHRLRAASALFERLEAACATDPEAKLIVIGHSHGGTVISLMLSRHPEIASLLSGVVFLSTPFIVASRRPHTARLESLSEHIMPMLAGAAYMALSLLMFFLLSSLGKTLEVANWAKPAVMWYWPFAFYLTISKVTNSRLPEVTRRDWFQNLLALNACILITLTLPALLYGWIKSASVSETIALPITGVALASAAFVSYHVATHLNLLRTTVSDESHISTSISQLLADFQQSSVPRNKALVVRFTSDEASLILSVAQAAVKAIDIITKALTAILSVFSRDYWRAIRRPLGAVGRFVWFAALAVALALFARSLLGGLLAFLGFASAGIDSLLDATLNLKIPDRFDLANSLPIRLLDWLEPHLWWSINFSDRSYTSDPFKVGSALIVTSLASASLLLALPFGAISFWGSLFVEFSVESAPAGDCQLVTFSPSHTHSDFWNTWQLAHSQAYSDARAIEVVAQAVALWHREPSVDGNRNTPN